MKAPPYITQSILKDLWSFLIQGLRTRCLYFFGLLILFQTIKIPYPRLCTNSSHTQGLCTDSKSYTPHPEPQALYPEPVKPSKAQMRNSQIACASGLLGSRSPETPEFLTSKDSYSKAFLLGPKTMLQRAFGLC